MMDAVAALAPRSGLIRAACAAPGLSRASLHRRKASQKQGPAAKQPRPSPRRALAAPERRTVLDLLRGAAFAGQAPAEVHAALLDRGGGLCPIRAMYRVLAAEREVRGRRGQSRRPACRKPDLPAQGPNQVWSRDIAKLIGPAKGSDFHLYAAIDLAPVERLPRQMMYHHANRSDGHEDTEGRLHA